MATPAESPLELEELEKQIICLQQEIQELKDIRGETLPETPDHQRIEKEIQTKEQILSDLQHQLCEADEQSQELRRSIRPRNPTPKMLELQKEEARKRERKFLSTYDQWKKIARHSREQLKTEIIDSELASLIEILETAK